MIGRPEFDYDTTAEAREALLSMFDINTREGQRLFEGAMREARIRERDIDGNQVGARIVVGEGRVTLRDSGGIECEIETTCGPKLLTFEADPGLKGDRIQVVLVRE